MSIYARGRDYHKVLRSRLQKLQERMAALLGPFGHRVFTDSAPVMEAELAVRSGQGWRGKNTLVLQKDAGSFFFLGELFVDMALPFSDPVTDHCGSCTACLDVCPTQAIVAPYKLDARRCISYLTIEHAGPIPEEFRASIGNRIYGCDDCQWACPWNKFAQRNALPDFDERKGLTGQQLTRMFAWTEEEFLRHTEGSPIRRIGHERWRRNLAVAIGNALRVLPESTLRSALGAALATTLLPMVPPAPARLSAMTVHLSCSFNLVAIKRDKMSVPPPGGKGTMKRIGRVGQSWAAVEAQAMPSSTPITAATTVRPTVQA